MSAAMHIYDQRGQRKYLTLTEWQSFLRAAAAAPDEVRTFCETLAYTGCRISEALALTAARVDTGDGMVVIESLKKRRRGIYRTVPVPPAFLDRLERTHGLKATHALPDRGSAMRLWPWSRATAWRRVCEVMEAAGITGLHATPKGLRHGFGIRAISSGVPLNMAQKWLGHARLETTAIYADATGPEERQFAQRMWG
jgi:integrase